MKNTYKLVALVFCITAAAIAAWQINGGAFLAEIFFGSYAIIGLFYQTSVSYPNRQPTAKTRSGGRNWIKLSLGRRRQNLRAATNA